MGILSVVKPNIGSGMFWRLLVGTVAMLAFGYAGESGQMNPWMGFFFGMCGWGFILQEIFVGEAGTLAASVVSVGWSIYPLGYFFGYLMGNVNDDVLNLVYNLADFVNKIGFCLAIWNSAKQDTRQKAGR